MSNNLDIEKIIEYVKIAYSKTSSFLSVAIPFIWNIISKIIMCWKVLLVMSLLFLGWLFILPFIGYSTFTILLGFGVCGYVAWKIVKESGSWTAAFLNALLNEKTSDSPSTQNSVSQEEAPTSDPYAKFNTTSVIIKDDHCVALYDGRGSFVRTNYVTTGRIVSQPVVNGDTCTIISEEAGRKFINTYTWPDFHLKNKFQK